MMNLHFIVHEYFHLQARIRAYPTVPRTESDFFPGHCCPLYSSQSPFEFM